MLENDPTDPRNTDIWSQDHRAPFARRSVNFIFGAIAIVLFLSFAFLFPFWNSDEKIKDSSDSANTSILVNIDPDTGEEVGVIAKVFNNAVQGLDADIFNMGDYTPNTIVGEMAQLEIYYNAIEAKDDGYRQSFRDALYSDVKGAKGENAGTLHDIIIDRNTGEARAVIIDKDNSFFDRELAALKFENIRTQQPDGSIKMAISEKTLDEKREFNYAQKDNDRFISLKSLRNGQVIDDMGKYVGEIDAVIYQNAEVQDIYFLIKPSLVPAGESRLFKISYDLLKLVKNQDGYDVQLTTQETKYIAAALYTN